MIKVPASFHENFEIVARYYGVRATGEYEELKEYARKSIEDFREYTLTDFLNMANWMSDYLPEPPRKGVVPILEKKDENTGRKGSRGSRLSK